MYLSKDREQAPKSSKKMIIAATAGLAVAGVATVSYMNQSDNLDFTQLASAPQLGDQFYNSINKGCDEWYNNAS
jgi:ABC-type sugar transport system substrate-binding protein